MLADVPMVFILLGLVAYTVLAGADFGAGFWTLVARAGRAGPAAARDHARHAMGPVWEANHVWLVFVLVVCWTAYPVAFGSIASTLAVPLLVAGIGIVLRGSAYALRGQLDTLGGRRRAIENVFAVSSILTPFALGSIAGAIASGRVPVGNAAGDPVTSWLNPTSVAIGALTVATSAYLAAVYLAADARRLGEQALEADFRARSVRAGIAAGALALAGLLVVRSDAAPLWDGFTEGAGAAMVAASAAAGLATLLLVRRSRFEAARVTAALAVAAIVAGWALAQQPRFLPGLTIAEAAAGRSTLVAVVVAVGVGSLVLVPSLILLFTLFLRGSLGDVLEAGPPPLPERGAARGARRLRLRGGLTLASLVVGSALLVLSEAGWAHAAGIACLCAFAASTFARAATLPEDAAQGTLR